MRSFGFDSDLVIVTEDACGNPYMIQSKYILDVLDDWNGNCDMVPANDARVFLVIHNNKPINPHLYTDFASLMGYLADYVRR